MNDAEKIKDQLSIELKEQELAKQLEFERLIAELAARLAQVLPENIDAEIQEILGSLGQFLQSERAFLFQFTNDEKSLKNTHVWAAEGFSPQSEIFELDLASDIPWVARQIRSRRVIAVGPGYDGLPDEAQELRQQLERDGINSGFVVPISVEGRPIGMLGLDTVDKAREYPPLLINRLRALADLIGSILQRIRTHRTLEQYRHIVESTTSIVGLVDQSYLYQYVNSAYCAAFQKDRQEIIGHTVADFLGKEMFQQIVKPHYDRCFAGEEVAFQAWIEFVGWGKRYMDVRYSPFFDFDGKVTAVVVSAHDITDIKQLDNELKESQERFQAFMENIPGAVYIKNENDVHVYCNQYAAAVVGIKPEDFIGSRTHDLFPPKEADHLVELDRKVLNENVARLTDEYNYTVNDGFCWYRDIKFPIKLESGKKLLGGISFDISERKQAEQSLAEQLEFERVIADIAAKLAQTRPEQLKASIDSTLQALGCFLKTERAFLAQFTPDGKSLYHSNFWAAQGIDVPAFLFDELDFAAESPWLANQLRLGKVVNTGPGLVELPDEAEDLRRGLERDGINSGVIVPVRVEGKSLGMLGLDTVEQPREYPPSIVDRLKIVADLTGSMLHRARVQRKLQQSERRFRAFMDNLPAHAYIKDNSDRHIYANKTTLDYMGRSIEEFIGLKTNDIWPDEVSNKIKQLDRKVFSENEARVVEEWRVEQEGETSWISDIKFPIHLSKDEKLLGGIGVDITERKLAEQELQDAFSEIKRLNAQLEAENIYLREEIELHHKHHEIVGNSEVVRKMLSRAEQVADTDSTVLILGETGTGKELLARAIHRMSSRHHRPMITVNCAALPASLIESEMFGREKGAFTGALSERIGRFEFADGSTIFLDEIGELTPDVQMKLLRVLEKGHFERLGSNKTIKVDVRIIAATNRDLIKAVHEGNFRRDLFYRLNVFPINVPSLQVRIEDLELLVWAFVKEYGERMGKRIESIPKKSIEALKRCPWRGNIRELRNVIEQSMIITNGPTLKVQIPKSQPQIEHQSALLKDVERNHIHNILKKTGWRVRGIAGAAELLGLKPTTLEARMKKLGILRPT